jgi:lysosomal acid phosphatase
MIWALERIAFNGDPLKFLLIESTYQPFISLFHQIQATKPTGKQLEGIRESSRLLVVLLLWSKSG